MCQRNHQRHSHLSPIPSVQSIKVVRVSGRDGMAEGGIGRNEGVKGREKGREGLKKRRVEKDWK